MEEFLLFLCFHCINKQIRFHCVKARQAYNGTEYTTEKHCCKMKATCSDYDVLPFA